ncbi:hypothetical protein [Streptomyces sp. NBC_01481]|uniref:hypothetical protein n=1 Tax=Streptomyces sp. NBC_01481 TaxID=2975869 RepID=UPI00225B17F2|nr:hypothetical protein [Streptomyces sp. NBC_01481]MCX4584725.1 hypothetical protein [Streptomyces sp. NBC_01481]
MVERREQRAAQITYSVAPKPAAASVTSPAVRPSRAYGPPYPDNPAGRKGS